MTTDNQPCGRHKTIEQIQIIHEIVGYRIRVAPIDPQHIIQTAPYVQDWDAWLLRDWYAVDTNPYRIYRFIRYRRILDKPYCLPYQAKGDCKYVQAFHKGFRWWINQDKLCRKALETYSFNYELWIQNWFYHYWTATQELENV